MSVKIKVTVDPTNPPEEGKIFRCGTFFIKLSDDTYNSLMMMCIQEKKDFQTLFVEVIREGIDRAEKEHGPL